MGRNARRANIAPRGRGLGKVAEDDEDLAFIRLKNVHDVTMASTLDIVLKIRGRVDVGRHAHLGAHLREDRVGHGGHGLPELLLDELPDGDAGDCVRESVFSKSDKEEPAFGLHEKRREHVGEVSAVLPDPFERRVLGEH